MDTLEILAVVAVLTESAARLLAVAKANGADVEALIAEYDRIHARVMMYQPLPPRLEGPPTTA